jgi:hypothetical protein
MNDKSGRLKIASVVIALLFAASARVGVRTGAAARSPQQEKTLGQTGKNIKVLGELPQSQIFPLMNFISASLGVRCDYCHVNGANDKWVWESDAKPTKMTARRMMLMQIEINRGNSDILGAGGAAAVTCFTCHRGQTRPANSPALPHVPTQAEFDAGSKQAPPPEPLPTVGQVLDAYFKAIGGRAAFEKSKTRVSKGSQIQWDGTALPIEIYRKSPDKYLAVLTRPGNDVVLTGFNGVTGWSQNQRQGLREFSGAQVTQLRRAADFFGDFRLREDYTDMAVAGREKVGARDAYVIVARASDKRIERLYFEVATGLLLRIAATTETPLARLPEETVFEDYREVDGVKLPFTVRASFIDPFVGWTRKFTEVKHNVALEDSKFDKPAVKK